MRAKTSNKIETADLSPLRERIAESIRASIIDGRVKPGERLTEPDVAKQLGVSRTPIREAFFQLISEGFVEVAPRRGVVVAELSQTDAEETYVLKSALESLAASLALDHSTPELISLLKSINEELAEAIEKTPVDLGRVLDLNNRFHQTMTDASGNRKLSRIVTVYRRQTLRYTYIYLSALGRLRHSVTEHRAMIRALEKGERAELERLVRSHNEGTLKSLRSTMTSSTPTR